MKCCRVTRGHVSFSASARASSTIRCSQGLLHSLLSSACSFTHSYWFFIDPRSPPVPPILTLPSYQPPPPSPPFSKCKVKRKTELDIDFFADFSLPLPLFPSSCVDPASLSLSLSRTSNLSKKASVRWTPRCGEERCWGSFWITAPTYEKRCNATFDLQLEAIIVKVQKYKQRLECQKKKNTDLSAGRNLSERASTYQLEFRHTVNNTAGRKKILFMRVWCTGNCWKRSRPV